MFGRSRRNLDFSILKCNNQCERRHEERAERCHFINDTRGDGGEEKSKDPDPITTSRWREDDESILALRRNKFIEGKEKREKEEEEEDVSSSLGKLLYWWQHRSRTFTKQKKATKRKKGEKKKVLGVREFGKRGYPSSRQGGLESSCVRVSGRIKTFSVLAAGPANSPSVRR